MISAIRIRTTIESEVLRIPELAALVGRRVEVIVVEEDVEDVPDGVDAGAAKGRILGGLQGLLHVPDDFDDPLPEEILRSFEGDE
jgi:hypothetical protein